MSEEVNWDMMSHYQSRRSWYKGEEYLSHLVNSLNTKAGYHHPLH